MQEEQGNVGSNQFNNRSLVLHYVSQNMKPNQHITSGGSTMIYLDYLT